LNAEKVTEQSLDDGEDIEVHLIPLDELVPMMQRGEFIHALQAAALLQVLVHLGRVH